MKKIVAFLFVVFASLTLTVVTSAVVMNQFGHNMTVSSKWGIARSPDYGAKKATTFDYYGTGDGFGCAVLLATDGTTMDMECADINDRTVVAERLYDAVHYHAHTGDYLP